MKGGDLTKSEIKGLCPWLMRCFGFMFWNVQNQHSSRKRMSPVTPRTLVSLPQSLWSPALYICPASSVWPPHSLLGHPASIFPIYRPVITSPLWFRKRVFKNFFIKVWLIYNVPSISAVQQVTQSYIYVYSFLFFHTISYHVLSQEIGHSSLCCTVGPHCLPILNVIVCIY